MNSKPTPYCETCAPSEGCGKCGRIQEMIQGESQPLTIAGFDCSSTSPALFWMIINSKTFKIQKCGYKAITSKKGYENLDTKYFSSKDFNDYIDKYQKIGEHIHSSLKIDYLAVEDFSFGSTGRLTLLAEIVGYHKWFYYNKGTAIRLYAPPSWKKCFTGHGHADKLTVYDEYLKRIVNGEIEGFVATTGLPIPDKGSGVAPTSDILDAYGLCDTLLQELKVRAVKNSGADFQFPKHVEEVFRLGPKVKSKDLEEAYQNREFLRMKNEKK